MNTIDARSRAAIIVALIIRDLRDRRGLRQGWDGIDPDTQEEINEAWINLAADVIKRMH